MKTTFFRSIGLSLSAIVMAMHPFAQKTGSINEPVREFSYNIIKKTSSSIDNSSPVNIPSSVPYNGKVFKQFDKIFLDASNVKWSFATNGNYHAYFTKDGNLNSILFAKNGEIIYLINYVSEKQLPFDVKQLIEYNYEEFKITVVDKVFQDNRTIWVVELAGINHFITVRVEDGEIQEIEKLKKAD